MDRRIDVVRVKISDFKGQRAKRVVGTNGVRWFVFGSCAHSCSGKLPWHGPCEHSLFGMRLLVLHRGWRCDHMLWATGLQWVILVVRSNHGFIDHCIPCLDIPITRELFYCVIWPFINPKQPIASLVAETNGTVTLCPSMLVF